MSGERRGCDLTRRERFAMAAMQGLNAANFHSVDQSAVDSDTIAAWAVAQADTLIAELDRKPDTGEGA